MKGLEQSHANHSATPCAVERRDGRKGENGDDVNDDDKRDLGWPTTMTLTVRHSRYRALVARISYLSQDVHTSSSHRCGYVARW